MKINCSIPQFNIQKNIMPIIRDVPQKDKGHQKSINFMNSNAYYNMQELKVSFSGINKGNKDQRISQQSRYEGCIIGGAIGDALGAPIEFCDLKTIQNHYGANGVQELQICIESGEADFSDDTQMTIFTVDGILKSIGDKFDSNKKPATEDMYKSYINWYITQTEEISPKMKKEGWITSCSGLYQRKAPGDTCLSALKSGKIGTVENPINNSKGSGGVMRVAPIGLLYHDNPQLAFNIAINNAAITHGHPSGYLSAGFLASLIAEIINGDDITTAVDKSLFILDKYENSEEVRNKVILAKDLAASDISNFDAIKKIGQGWTGEEALGIALFCALRAPENYKTAVTMAVNHSGDSDTTGAITGNIMGALLGINSIPENWINKIQDKSLLTKLAKDLTLVPQKPAKYKKRYPYNGGRMPNWYEKTPAIQTTPRRLTYAVFSAEDEEKMKQMTPEEIIEFKKNLLNNKPN